ERGGRVRVTPDEVAARRPDDGRGLAARRRRRIPARRDPADRQVPELGQELLETELRPDWSPPGERPRRAGEADRLDRGGQRQPDPGVQAEAEAARPEPDRVSVEPLPATGDRRL